MTIYCVFDNDGCECSNLVGIFSTPEKAEAFAQRVRAANKDEHEWIIGPDEGIADMGSVTVNPLELNHEDDVEELVRQHAEILAEGGTPHWQEMLERIDG